MNKGLSIKKRFAGNYFVKALLYSGQGPSEPIPFVKRALFLVLASRSTCLWASHKALIFLCAICSIGWSAGMAFAENQTPSAPESIDVSVILPQDDLERIVRFVLQYGDTETYCSKDNNNPHYRFGEFDVYLHPKHQYIGYDPVFTDFSAITIRGEHGYTGIYSSCAELKQACDDKPVYLHAHGGDDLVMLKVYRRAMMREIEKAEFGRITPQFGRKWGTITNFFLIPLCEGQKQGGNVSSEERSLIKQALETRFPLDSKEIYSSIFDGDDFCAKISVSRDNGTHSRGSLLGTPQAFTEYVNDRLKAEAKRSR